VVDPDFRVSAEEEIDTRMKKRILAIASAGGHWQQLMRLRPAFQGQHATYVTTNAAYAVDVPGSELFVVIDANRNAPLNLIRSAFGMLLRVLKTRPDVVISTGAAPGLFGIVFGRFVGARTIWVESIANAETLSMSGRIASKIAHITLTQWPHLEGVEGSRYEGSIL
jgi:UDP-N-acetylglucosamine:LPS N-acetylglucosamine transferase